MVRVPAHVCREQQAIQLAKAASEPLESRRKIALTAAKAWGIEADLADSRTNDQTSLNTLDAAITQEFAREAAADADGEIGAAIKPPMSAP